MISILIITINKPFKYTVITIILFVRNGWKTISKIVLSECSIIVNLLLFLKYGYCLPLCQINQYYSLSTLPHITYFKFVLTSAVLVSFLFHVSICSSFVYIYCFFTLCRSCFTLLFAQFASHRSCIDLASP